MASISYRVVLLGLVINIFCKLYRPSLAFSASTSSYKIVGAAGGVQYLPASYATSFSFWTFEDSKLVTSATETTCNDSRAGYKIRPTLDILIKGSIPAYMMVGLQTNRGDRKQPPLLAQQWTTFNSLSVEPNVRLLVYQGAGDGTDGRLIYVPYDRVKNAIEALGLVLSDVDSDFLSTGFHVISFPLHEWTAIDDSESASLITCLITAEADPREIFTLEPDFLEMTATSYLQMAPDIRHDSSP